LLAVCALSLTAEGGQGRRADLNQLDVVVLDHVVDRLHAKLPIPELDLVAA
jgi:hypothetical protein